MPPTIRYYVMALEHNLGTGKWEEASSVSPPDFQMSIPISGVTRHPQRFITQVSDTSSGSETFDYISVSGVVLTPGDPSVLNLTTTTDSITAHLPIDIVGGFDDFTIDSTKLEISNTGLTSGSVGHYSLTTPAAAHRVCNVTAVTRDQTQIEVVTYNTGTSHWITRPWLSSDNNFNFPAATTNWYLGFSGLDDTLSVKYARHIKVLDTIDAPTGEGTIEGYGNITNWYQDPPGFAVTGNWFTGIIGAYTIYDASGAPQAAQLLTLKSDNSTHDNNLYTDLTLHVNPYSSQTGLESKTNSVRATAKTPLSITTPLLAPADNNNDYSFPINIDGDATLAHTWSASGLPTGYSINQNGFIISSNTVPRNKLTQNINTDVPVDITYTYTNSTNYLPITATRHYTFYQFAIQINNDTGNSNTLRSAVVGFPYDSSSPTNQNVSLVGNASLTDTVSNYSVATPTNWNGSTVTTLGVIASFYDNANGIKITSTTISSGAELSTLVSILVTHLAGSAPLPKPSGSPDFYVRRNIILSATQSQKTFNIYPGAITTRATTSGLSQDTIGIVMDAGSNFDQGNTSYTLTNDDDGNGGIFVAGASIYPIGATRSIATDPATWHSGLGQNEFIWIPLKSTAAAGAHRITVWREGLPKVLVVTIDNSIDTSSPSQISNVGYSGYSPSTSIISETPYSFYNASIGGTSPEDIDQTFSVTVNQSGAHLITTNTGVGDWQLSSSSTTIFDYIGIYTPNGTAGNPSVNGSSCRVKFKSSTVSTTMPDGYDQTAYLIFNTRADGSPSGTRTALIHVKKSHSTFSILPISLSPAPVVGSPVSQQFTHNSTHTPVVFSVANVDNVLFPIVSGTSNITTDGLFTSLAPHSSSDYYFDVIGRDAIGGIANQRVTGSISALSGDPTINTNGVTPSTFDKDSVQPLIIAGTNFGTVIGDITVVIALSPGINSSLTVQSVSASQINCTYNASVGTIGNYSLVVTKGSGAAARSASYIVHLTSTFTGAITSVTAVPNTANSSATLTVQGHGLGTTGSIGYKYFGSASDFVKYTTSTITNGDGTSTATAHDVPLGPQGGASVTFYSSAGSQSNVLNLTVAIGGVGTITLTDDSASSVHYTGSSDAGSPTPIDVWKNVAKSFTLSAGVSSPTWSLETTTLPANLTLNFDVGTITGIVVDASVSTTFSLKATSGSSSKKVYFRFNLKGGSLIVGAQTIILHQGEIGVNKPISTTGGTPPLIFSLDSPTHFPSGTLAFNNSTGYFSGNILASATLGDYVNNVTVRDSATSPASVPAVITLKVVAALTTPLITSLSPNVGSLNGGTPVTLNVTDVWPPFIVKFDNVSVTVTATSLSAHNGTITVTSPVHAVGDVPVTVTNTTDNQVSPSVNFTYSTIVAPNFASLSPLRDGPFEGGQRLTILGSNFLDGMTVKIDVASCTGWGSANIYSSGTVAQITTPLYVGTQPITEKLDVSITLANGGEQTVIANAYTYRPPPIIAAIIPPTGPSAGSTTIYIAGQNFFQVGNNKPRVFIGNYEIPQTNITLK